MQEVKDFPDEITGKTYSPVRVTPEGPKASVFSNFVAFSKKRLSMATGAYPKSPDLEAGKTAISYKDGLPATPEEDKTKRRRSSISNLFSRKSNSPATPISPPSRLAEMMERGTIEEEKECSEGGGGGSDDGNEQLDLALEGEEGDGPLQMSEQEDGDMFGSEPDSDWRQPGAGAGEQVQNALSKREYKAQLHVLNKRRQWAETAIRRTSDHFLSSYDATGKAAMDQFIVTMSRGLLVRRHQAGCAAQEVRLFSDDGCHSINWEPPKVIYLLVN
jgi:hypothetical protein